MRAILLFTCLSLLGCAEDSDGFDGNPDTADEVNRDVYGNLAQDALDCSAEMASIEATIHTVNIGINVCHESGVSVKLEVGAQVTGAVKHERLTGDFSSLGCTIWLGEVDVNYGLPAQGSVYRIPVGQKASEVSLDASYVAMDLLERVDQGGSYYTRYVEQEDDVIVSNDEFNTKFIHQEEGQDFMFVRVRPSHICPNTNTAEYTIEVNPAD